MVAQVLSFAARRNRPLDAQFRPGDRVVGMVDGEEREGTIFDTGDLVTGDVWIGPPGGRQQHRVAVVWDDPQMVDTATLHHI